MKPFLLLLFLFVSDSALAQVPLARYQPFAVGDEHVYAYHVAETATTSTCPAQQYVGSERVRVVADTLVDGQAGFVVTCDAAALGTGVTRVNRYAVRVGADGALAVATVRDGGGCALLGTSVALPGSATTVGEPGSVTVNGPSYAVPGVRMSRFSGASSGQTVGGTDQVFAADLGLVSHLSYQSRGLSPLYCRQYRRELVSASVSGRYYGVSVAGEAAAEAVRGLRAYPVPADRTVTVEADERTALEVVDALGRRVASGEAGPGAALRLDVSGWPAGVYVARTVGGPVQTARLVVAR